jgi:hypothetical protein
MSPEFLEILFKQEVFKDNFYVLGSVCKIWKRCYDAATCYSRCSTLVHVMPHDRLLKYAIDAYAISPSSTTRVDVPICENERINMLAYFAGKYCGKNRIKYLFNRGMIVGNALLRGILEVRNKSLYLWVLKKFEVSPSRHIKSKALCFFDLDDVQDVTVHRDAIVVAISQGTTEDYVRVKKRMKGIPVVDDYNLMSNLSFHGDCSLARSVWQELMIANNFSFSTTSFSYTLTVAIMRDSLDYVMFCRELGLQWIGENAHSRILKYYADNSVTF